MKKSKIDEAFDIDTFESVEDDDYNQTELINYDDMTKLPSVNIIHDPYDSKDEEIEIQFQTVYDKAMDAFDTQQELSEDVEGKFLARNGEVANQLLGTALSAAKEKANLKHHSDQLQLKKSGLAPDNGNTTNIQNNNILMDRNDLLKMMKGE